MAGPFRRTKIPNSNSKLPIDQELMRNSKAVLPSVRLLLCLACLLLASPCLSQQNTFPGKALDNPPTIDGVVSEAEWSSVPSAKGGYDEQTGALDPYGSQYWLAYR